MENKFINRKQELKFLNGLYKKTRKEAQFLVLYGKRRVGKTELIKHFINKKPSIYYLATRGNAQDQLKTASELITSYFGDSEVIVATWRSLFDYIGKKLKTTKKRVVIIFDEFPFLVESDEAISSYFQYGWDEQLKNTNAIVVLMGSSISMMYKHALVHSAPLYGRRTAQWLLEPFTFAESKKFFASNDFEKNFSLYSITGGIPAYLKTFDITKTLENNIKDNILTKGAFLSLEPELLVSEEFRETRNYLTILKAIGLGGTKYSDLLNLTGLENNILPSYLSTLINLRLIKKEVSVTEDSSKSKRGIYFISDNFLRFYFTFVYPNASLIEKGATMAFFDKIKNEFATYVAKIYEETAVEFVEKKQIFPQIGRWWDNNTEIDLVGLDKEKNAILFGEVKWTNQPVGFDVLNALIEKSKKVIWGKAGRFEQFVLVSKSGFTPKLKLFAKENGIWLFEKDTIL